MDQKPALSLIAPVYNTSAYLDEFLSSIENQTDRNFELILVDDGSTDDSGKKLDEFAQGKNWVRVIHQTNRGLGLSRNEGLKAARGEFVAFPDSDDRLHPDYVRVMKNLADQYDATVVYGNISSDPAIFSSPADDKAERVIHQDQIHDYVLERVGLPAESDSDRYYGAVVNASIFKRSWLNEHDFKFVSERDFIAEDIIFDIQALPEAETIVHAKAPLYWYRPDNTGSLTRVYRKDRFEKNKVVFEEMERLLSKNYTEAEYRSPMDRYILTALRNLIFQDARYLKVNGRKFTKEHIALMCQDPVVQKAAWSYPVEKMPMKKGVFARAMKNQNADRLLLLAAAWVKLRK